MTWLLWILVPPAIVFAAIIVRAIVIRHWHHLAARDRKPVDSWRRDVGGMP
jgi:hypothetical protein